MLSGLPVVVREGGSGEKQVQQDWKGPAKGLIKYSTVGLEIAGSVLFGLLGGQWLDRNTGLTPILTVLGFGFGLAAAIRTLLRTVKSLNADAADEALKSERERRRYHDRNSD